MQLDFGILDPVVFPELDGRMLLTKTIIWASCGAFLLLSAQLVLVLKFEFGNHLTFSWRNICSRTLVLMIPLSGAILIADRVLFPVSEPRIDLSCWIVLAGAFALTTLMGVLDVVSARIKVVSGVDVQQRYRSLLMLLSLPFALAFIVARVFFWG